MVEAWRVRTGHALEVLEIGEATTTVQREAVFRFWYSVYVAELGRYRDIADHENRRLKGPEDEVSHIFYARDGDEVVGACRINWGGDGFTERQIRQYDLQPFLDEIPAELMLVGERTMVAASHRGGSVYTEVAMAVTPLSEQLGIVLSFGACEPHLVSYYAKFGQRPYASRQYFSEESGYIVPTLALPFGLDRFGDDVPPSIQQAWSGASVVSNAAVDGDESYASDLREATIGTVGPGSLFHGMSEHEVAVCANRGTILTCAAGDQILRVGGTARNPFMVLSGGLEARHDDRPWQSLGPGDLFGESGWLGDQDRQVNVFAVEEGSRILALSQGVLASLGESNPELAAKLSHNVARALWSRLRDTGDLTG